MEDFVNQGLAEFVLVLAVLQENDPCVSIAKTQAISVVLDPVLKHDFVVNAFFYPHPAWDLHAWDYPLNANGPQVG